VVDHSAAGRPAVRAIRATIRFSGGRPKFGRAAIGLTALGSINSYDGRYHGGHDEIRKNPARAIDAVL
jgi:hypothetical protein